jgi:hypothetical protein
MGKRQLVLIVIQFLHPVLFQASLLDTRARALLRGGAALVALYDDLEPTAN